MMLVAASLATSASGQTPGYGLQIDAEESSVQTDDTGCASFNATVRNTGQAPAPPEHDISLSAEADDDAWTIEPTPPGSIQLAPGDEETVTFGACAGGAAEDGASTTVTLTAVVESDPGTEKASATADFTANLQIEDDTGDDESLDNDTGEQANGNETGDTADSPGPGGILLVATLASAILMIRRRH